MTALNAVCGRCVLIMAGGTGGHVFPALAVAEKLRERGVNVVWLGTRSGMEAKLVAAAGFDMEWISISGLRGNGVLRWLMAPLRLMVALAQSLQVIMRRRPVVVLGMGGFVSGPGGLMCWLLHKPLLIHEQNALAGLTNRLLARVATRVMKAFPASLPQRRDALLCGNPVRSSIAELPAPEQRMAGRSGPLRLLVLGGSQGAAILNETVPQAVHALDVALRPQIWHQTGRGHCDTTQQRYQDFTLTATVEAFVDDMAAAYQWADVVLCRAGALTVAEVAAAGVAALLVPYPHAVDDHQTCNARYLVDGGAALLLPQATLNAHGLAELIAGLERGKLLAMACCARGLAMPEAAERVAAVCLEAIEDDSR